MAEREQQNEKDKNVIEFEPRGRSADEQTEVRPGETSEEGSETGAADERLARLQAEKDELMQTMVRRQADFENYRKRIERERQDDYVTVILPEFVPAKWWQHLLHNQRALLIKGALLFRPNTVVTSVPFHLAK